MSNTIKIGFTGTREGMSTRQKAEVEKFLNDEARKCDRLELHHGDCVGADADFHSICERLAAQKSIVIHPPSNGRLRAHCKGDEVLPAKEYLDRNRDIVDGTDMLVGCPVSEVEEVKSGTWYTIRYAKKINKPVQIIV